MYKIAFTMAAIGIATLSLSTPAHAGNGSAVGAGLFGFGVGAIVGSALAPQTLCRTPTARLSAPPPPVYVAPPAPVYVGPVYYGHPAYRWHRR